MNDAGGGVMNWPVGVFSLLFKQSRFHFFLSLGLSPPVFNLQAKVLINKMERIKRIQIKRGAYLARGPKD